MASTSENLRLILGLKLRNLRLARRRSLKQIAGQAGLSTSYLSELEQGKKYPKPDKLLRLAEALEIPYDDLVSLKVTDELSPLKEAVSSGFVREFPFELFGLEREDLVRLISVAPGKAGALIQSLVEIGRSYDVQVEHFLLSALRSYQQMHANYFEDLEQAAADFRRAQGWSPGRSIDEQMLQEILRERWGYRIEEQIITEHAQLRGFRSVFIQGEAPILHVNARLLPIQKVFILARELGYRILDLKERTDTSSWIKIEGFAQILNNFKASYFAGALLIDRELLEAELRKLFSSATWDPAAFLQCMDRFGATPEMFLYRLTELVPQLFGLERIFFLRFHRRLETESAALTKVFNLSGVPVPYGVGLKEHYCRRWPGLELLAPGRHITAQRSRFLEHDAEFFVIALGRQLVLEPGGRSSVSIGLLLDEGFQRAVRFWNDPAVPRVEVHLTCERCSLSPEECDARVAPPDIYERERRQQQQEVALAALAESNH